MSILPLSADSRGHPFLPRHWWEGGEAQGSLGGCGVGWWGGGGITWGERHHEESGGDGFVILVIKDRVASMPGARTGCGKLLESLWGKAAPSLLCPFSGDLIIFSNSQDGILYPLFPHLLLPSFCLSSHFLSPPSVTLLLKCISKSKVTLQLLNCRWVCWWWTCGAKCKTFKSYFCRFYFPLKHVVLIKHWFHIYKLKKISINKFFEHH